MPSPPRVCGGLARRGAVSATGGGALEGESVEVVPLAPESAAAAALLLARYAADDGAGPVDVEPYRAAVANHLAADLAADGSPFVLARRGGLWVGFIHLGWGRSTGSGLPVLRVQGLYVAPAHRRRGVGRALLAHAEGMARAGGACRLQLGVDRDNVAARRLYEQSGFAVLPGKRMLMKFL